MVEGIMVEGIVVSPWVDEQGPREIGRLGQRLGCADPQRLQRSRRVAANA